MADNSQTTANPVFDEKINEEQNDPGNGKEKLIDLQDEDHSMSVAVEKEPENNVVNPMNEDEESLIPTASRRRVPRDLSDVTLWINVQEVVYRNLSESSFFSIVVSFVFGGIAAAFIWLVQDVTKIYVASRIMMFFCASYFLASCVESFSCNQQSNIFGNSQGICSKLRNMFCTIWKYPKGCACSSCAACAFILRTIGIITCLRKVCTMCTCTTCTCTTCTSPFIRRAMRTCMRNIQSSALTPMAVSDDISLWLFMQATAVKKTSLINFGVSIISFVLFIVFLILALLDRFLDEELMIVRTCAFYFLGSCLYTLTESFSCFIQAAIIANIHLEEDLFDNDLWEHLLQKFSTGAKRLLAALLTQKLGSDREISMRYIQPLSVVVSFTLTRNLLSINPCVFKNTTSAPRLLIAVVAGVITALVIIYGVCIGWTAWPIYPLYLFVILYVFLVCRSPKTTCYTVAGSICSCVILALVKYMNPFIAVSLSIVTVFVVTLVSEQVVKEQTQYVHVPNEDYVPPEESPRTKARSAARAKKAEEQANKKGVKTVPLSRKEKKALLKQEKRNKN